MTCSYIISDIELFYPVIIQDSLSLYYNTGKIANPRIMEIPNSKIIYDSWRMYEVYACMHIYMYTYMYKCL